MTKDQLLEMLANPEWDHLEFKAASTSVPEDAYETVSAFANTAGGWLVFGIEQDKTTKATTIAGVADMENLASHFINAIRGNDLKLNKPVKVDTDYFELEDKHILVFEVKEAAKYDKPVFAVIKKKGEVAYLRRAASDVQCTTAELGQLYKEASGETYDGQLLDLPLNNCFNHATIDSYRAIYHQPERNNSFPPRSLNDTEFLRKLGLIVEKDAKLYPTRASILLFGTDSAMAQTLVRPVVDCLWTVGRENEPLTEERYTNRLISNKNLLETWKDLLEKYHLTADNPFRVDSTSLQRVETSDYYISFREATMNVFLHQDYSIAGQKASLRFYRDVMVFFNPGCSLVRTEQLLEYTESHYRNPLLVKYFQKIGLCEQMGSGIKAVYGSWRNYGYVPPQIDNNRADNCFTLRLTKEILFTEEQINVQARFGLTVSDPAARVLALVYRQKQISYFDVKGVTGLDRPEADPVLAQLLSQQVIRKVEAHPEPYYKLAEHLNLPEVLPPSATLDPTRPPRRTIVATNTQIRILRHCSTPRSLADIKQNIGPKNSRSEDYRQLHLIPLLEEGYLSLEKEDKPADYPRQQFVTTSYGNELVALRYNSSGQPPAATVDQSSVEN